MTTFAKTSRAVQTVLVAAFLLTIVGVGVVQAVVEATRGERPQVCDLFTQTPTEANLRVFENEMEDTSWLATWVRPRMQAAQFVVLRAAGENALVGREGWFFYKPGARFLIEPWSPETDSDPVKAIVAYRDALEARGIHLLVVPAPGKASVCPGMLASRSGAPGARVDSHTRGVIERLREAKVDVIVLAEVYSQAEGNGSGNAGTDPSERSETGLSPAFSRASRCNSTFVNSLTAPHYLAQDTHWSPSGMTIAANAVARHILDGGWAEKGDTRYVIEPAPLARHGDLVKMAKSPPMERMLEPEDVACERVIDAETKEPYQDSVESDVLILGDSFLRIYERDEPGSAGFIAHLARELDKPLASIVNDGGASTLVRQQLYRKPEMLQGKKIVVWEFVERDLRFGMGGWQDVPLPAGS